MPLWRLEVSSESLRQFLLKNLTRDENGRLRWKIHLEAIDQNYDKLVAGAFAGAKL